MKRKKISKHKIKKLKKYNNKNKINKTNNLNDDEDLINDINSNLENEIFLEKDEKNNKSDLDKDIDEDINLIYDIIYKEIDEDEFFEFKNKKFKDTIIEDNITNLNNNK